MIYEVWDVETGNLITACSPGRLVKLVKLWLTQGHGLEGIHVELCEDYSEPPAAPAFPQQGEKK